MFMNKKIIFSALRNIVNSKKNIFIILYLLLGCFLFTNANAKESYIYIFTIAIMRQNFILIFLFPPLLILFIQCFNYFYNNKYLTIRSETRKNMFKYTVFTGLLLTLYYYIVVILCMGIMTNIIMHTSELYTYYFGYDVYDFYILILQLIKLLLLLVVMFFLTMILIYKLKNIKMVICGVYIILMILFLGNSLMYNFDFFDISGFINNFRYTRVFSKNVIESLIFYAIIISSLSLIAKRIGVNFKNISGTNDD